jgi:basic membrane protein A
MDRRDFLTAAGIAGISAFAGCTGGPTGGNGNGTEGGNGTGTKTKGTANGKSAAQIAMVYATGGLGDGSFNDQAQDGIQKAKKKLGVTSDKSQPESVSDFGQFQRRYAQSKSPDYELVCCIGGLQKDALTDTAPKFPKQKFTIIDATVNEENVESYRFREHQGSFQVGHLAGLLTGMNFSAGKGKTNSAPKVGFVGGVKIPLIKKFEAGYLAGVKYVNKDIDVLSTYVGSFNDVAGGKRAATAQYKDGADIIYHASGNTGTGVFQAAKQLGRYAIGVDSDQSITKSNYADVILASMVKHVDIAVFNSVKHVVNNNFQGGTTTKLGLEENGVETVYGQSLGPKIPKKIKSKLETSRQKIISGKIEVPKKPSNV